MTVTVHGEVVWLVILGLDALVAFISSSRWTRGAAENGDAEKASWNGAAEGRGASGRG